MKEPFDQHEEYEPVDLCENCAHAMIDENCLFIDDDKEHDEITDCYFFKDSRPTKQDIEDERADYLIQCAKDERAERR